MNPFLDEDLPLIWRVQEDVLLRLQQLAVLNIGGRARGCRRRRRDFCEIQRSRKFVPRRHPVLPLLKPIRSL